jgi:type IV secretory pathway VirB2 component (pilin)
VKNATPLTINERRRYFVAAMFSFVLASPAGAYAQAAGGSFLNGLLNWVQGNVITTLGTLAIIVVGLVMLSMRASFVAIFAVCAGIWVIFNASTLAGLLRQ